MEHVILPALGEGIEKAKVAFWHASVGDEVAVDLQFRPVGGLAPRSKDPIASGHGLGLL